MSNGYGEERCVSAAPVLSTPGRTEPSIHIEAELWARGLRLVAGVDEVGRGCVAGPVVAAACILPPGIEDIPGTVLAEGVSFEWESFPE